MVGCENVGLLEVILADRRFVAWLVDCDVRRIIGRDDARLLGHVQRNVRAFDAGKLRALTLLELPALDRILDAQRAQVRRSGLVALLEPRPDNRIELRLRVRKRRAPRSQLFLQLGNACISVGPGRRQHLCNAKETPLSVAYISLAAVHGVDPD